MHVLEAGFEGAGRPLVLLLHGFPELAYSWRKVMLPLAQAGYHVVAPDQRGYGRTSGWDGHYDGDFASFRSLNLVRDALALVFALGYRAVAGVFGHDAGATVAGWAALVRPDVFRSVALMSAPFAGPPSLPAAVPAATSIHDDLAALARPRKHYQWYYST
ncbi:MAG: alpha/beta fold hydrolase, partial [Ramlibacter sp.]